VRKNLRGGTAGFGDAEVRKGIRRATKGFATAIGDGGKAVTEKIASTDGIRKHRSGPQAMLRARLKEPFSASIFF